MPDPLDPRYAEELLFEAMTKAALAGLDSNDEDDAAENSAVRSPLGITPSGRHRAVALPLPTDMDEPA